MEILDNLAANATNDTSKWEKRLEKTAKAEAWFLAFNFLLLLFSSSIIFFLVICKRKSRDPFAIILLTNYILASTLIVFESFIYVGIPELEKFRKVILSFGNTFYLFAHWAFASKYLKTTYVLPNLLV